MNNILTNYLKKRVRDHFKITNITKARKILYDFLYSKYKNEQKLNNLNAIN